MDDRGMKIIGTLVAVSNKHQVVPAVIALAWLLQRKCVVAAIASVTSVQQMAELAKVNHVKLSPEEITGLDTASSYG